MERGGRGRARGRSKPQAQQEGQPGPAPYVQVPRGAWGAGPPQLQQVAPPQGVWGAPRHAAPPPLQSAGRGVHRIAGEDVGASAPRQGAWGAAPPPPDVGGSGAGEDVSAGASGASDGSHSGVQRGAFRGRRELHVATLKTKPDGMGSKQGTSGRPVKLTANYFPLISNPDWCLYQYRVDFSTDVDSTAQRKGMFRTAVKSLNLSGNVFDGSVMFTPRRLNPDPMEIFVDPIDGQGEKIRITIRLVGTITKGDYQYIQIFNLIIRKCMGHLNLQLVGRQYCDPKAKIMIPEYNLELWPGYSTSIRQNESGILMCVETIHKVMRIDTVFHLLMECSTEDRANVKRLFADRIIGKVVLTGYNNRTYRIDDVDFTMTPENTFTKKDGSSISYQNYFRERYGINITQKTQPLLISKAKAREIRAGMQETIILVPELCRLTGLTDSQKTNFNLMKHLAEHTRVGPPRYIQTLQNFSRRLLNEPNSFAEILQWDLKFKDTLVELNGRVLDQEILSADGDRQKYQAGKFCDWTKELRSRKQFIDVPIKQWIVVYPGKLRASVQKFLNMVSSAAKGMRYDLGEAKTSELSDDKIGSYLSALNAAIAAKVEFIMIVVMNNKNDRYSALKKKCCVEHPMPTQVICARSLDSKGAMSIATKVAIQMNCKVGGAPWAVRIPVTGLMVVGYDVCHDPQAKNRSFGAMVASLDRNITRYFSVASPHVNGEELSNDFALNMVRAVRKFQEFNEEKLPERILIYRDGVGDGQLPYVHEHEVSKIVKALEEYYKGPVRLTFIVVSKRINTRIFCGGQNPEPGTVVDDVITLPERYDFFLTSTCSRQGTVTPTSYNVIYDKMGFSADKLHILTNKLTHMYYNWSGTIRVPAPCQYAHKLAFLVAQSLHRVPHRGLETLLYYL